MRADLFQVSTGNVSLFLIFREKKLLGDFSTSRLSLFNPIPLSVAWSMTKDAKSLKIRFSLGGYDFSVKFWCNQNMAPNAQISWTGMCWNKMKAWNKHLRIWKKFENRCFQTFIYVSIQLYEVVVKINAVTWCINFRKCFKKLSSLEALLSENHVFPVIDQSGRCQLEINDGILWVVTLSQNPWTLGYTLED